MMSKLDRLPDELKLGIMNALHADSSNLSTKTTKDAAVQSNPTSSPLKCLSLVSRAWYALVRPVLFARLVVRLDQRADPDDGRSPTVRFREALKTGARSVDQFFTKHADPCAAVESVNVLVMGDQSDQAKALRAPVGHSTDLISITNFWACLFRHFDPITLRVVAPVCIMGWLLMQDMSNTDVWAFPGMATTSLTLQQDPRLKSKREPIATSRANGWDTEYLFDVRPWTHIYLDEGSMVHGYGFYEYYNKMPPCLISSFLHPPSRWTSSFHHKIILPFTGYTSGYTPSNWMHQRHIELEYAPAADENFLDDPNIVENRIDLQDCWAELDEIYRQTVEVLNIINETDSASLVSFVSRDCHIVAVRERLYTAFERYKAYGWKEIRLGRWERSLPQTAD